MSELFNIPESLSPKLAWLKKHGLMVHFDASLYDCPESPETGDTCYPWICQLREQDPCRHCGLIGVGNTEDEAILDYCERHNLKHWTLE